VHTIETYPCLDLRLRLFLILQQSSTIRTAKIVQMLDTIPAMVNVSKMKAIVSTDEVTQLLLLPRLLAETVPVEDLHYDICKLLRLFAPV